MFEDSLELMNSGVMGVTLGALKPKSGKGFEQGRVCTVSLQ